MSASIKDSDNRTAYEDAICRHQFKKAALIKEYEELSLIKGTSNE